MELHLVVPATPGDEHTEILNGTQWSVIGPVDIHDTARLKFHCVSYVWGPGRESKGGLFNSQIEISDQTRRALEVAIRAVEAIPREKGVPIVRAFWIDAICVPQRDGLQRDATLESMGFIYSAAESVIVVLQGPTWKVIKSASSARTPDLVQYNELKILEKDEWVRSPWTYQEIVNSKAISFTSLREPDSSMEDIVVNGTPFLNCIGFSLDQWRKKHSKTEIEVVAEFRNLNTLSDVLADSQVDGYLDRTALCVLSNIAQRRYHQDFPKNPLLAALGALTKDVFWGSPAQSVSELAEKVMETCENNGDYSFIFTADERDETPGLTWRPDPKQLKSEESGPVHLVPVIQWYSWGEKQRGRKDDQGFLWLENMAPLKPSATLGKEGREFLLKWIQESSAIPESKNGCVSAPGFARWEEGKGTTLEQVVLSSLRVIGFSGSDSYQMCENGIFFSQLELNDKEGLEIFAAPGIRWSFGAPAIARWKTEGVTKYCAGLFTGNILTAATQELLVY